MRIFDVSSYLLCDLQFPLNFRFRGNNASSLTNTYISVLEEASSDVQNDDLANALLLLPNLVPLDRSRAVSAVSRLLNDFSSKLTTAYKDPAELTIIALSVETLIHLNPDDRLAKLALPDDILKLLLQFCSEEHLCILRALDFYVCCSEMKSIEAHIPQIQERVVPLVRSPYHKVCTSKLKQPNRLPVPVREVLQNDAFCSWFAEVERQVQKMGGDLLFFAFSQIFFLL